jgi:hypothetical protein
MFGREKRFRREDARADGGGNVATAERTAPPPPTGEPVRERPSHASNDAVVLDRDARLRQRDKFGGFNWGAAFFGWIVAIGLGALLTAIVGAAGAAIGLTNNADQGDAATIGIVGGALLIAIALIAYYAGGYVAGRMSRFDGARQGFGVWVFGLLVTLALAAAGAILGNEYNVLEQLNLPRIPVSASDLTAGGAITLLAIFIGSLIAAIAGGKVGERYHRRVDRAALGGGDHI